MAPPRVKTIEKLHKLIRNDPPVGVNVVQEPTFDLPLFGLFDGNVSEVPPALSIWGGSSGRKTYPHTDRSFIRAHPRRARGPLYPASVSRKRSQDMTR